MRYKLSFLANNTYLPFDSAEIVTSNVNRWFGPNNNIHSTNSNISFSHLHNGKLENGKLFYENRIDFIISFLTPDLLIKFYNGLTREPFLLVGSQKFQLIESLEIKEKFYDGYNNFSTVSPILLKKDGKILTFNDPDFENVLKSQTLNKLKKICDNYSLKINLSQFDLKVVKPLKIKYVRYKNNKPIPANVIKFTVTCDNITAGILYNVGIGNSTGLGFGLIRCSETRDVYAF